MTYGFTGCPFVYSQSSSFGTVSEAAALADLGALAPKSKDWVFFGGIVTLGLSSNTTRSTESSARRASRLIP